MPWLLAASLAATAGAAEPPPLAVGGVLLGEGGDPGAGQVELVALRDHHATRLDLLAGTEPPAAASAEADELGRFRLPVPSRDMWSVVVRAPGRVPMRYLPLAVTSPLELPPVAPPADAGLEVTVRRHDGQPAAGAWAIAVGGSPELWRAVARDGWQPAARRARTDADGRARLPRLAGEELTVHVVAGGARGSVKVAGDAAGAAVRLAPPGPPRAVELHDAEDRPLAGAAVAAGSPPWPVAASDAEGRLELPAWAVGPLHVALADGRRWQVAPPAATTAAGEPLRLLLPPRPPLAVRVLDATTRRPLAGALAWRGDDPGDAATSGADGVVTLVTRDDDRAWIQVEAAGYAPRVLRLPAAGAGRGVETIVLEPAARLAGVVVDERGEPVAGAAVAAARRRPPYEVFDPDSAVRAASDAAGRFLLRGLAAQPAWELTASRHGFLAAQATVAAGAEARVVLSPARAASGAVVDPAERPLAGVEVTIRPGAGEPGRAVTARTDARGRFAVPALPAGRVDLEARRDGFAPRRVPGVTVPPGRGAVDLGVLMLAPGAAIAGRVSGADDEPLVGVEVWLGEVQRRPSRQQAHALRGAPPAATSDGAGRFAVPDLVTGTRWNVLLAAPGYLPAWVAGVAVPPDSPLRVTLRPASRVVGRVEDEAGRPVADARVELHPAPPPPGTVGVERWRSDEGAEVVSGPDGGFELTEVAPGAALLEVRAEGYLAAEPSSLQVPPGGEVTGLRLVLARGAHAAGEVTRSDGEPIAGARVRIGQAETTTDAAGRYRVAGVPLGVQGLLVRHPDYRFERREVEVEPGENRFDVTLVPGVTVSGRVFDEAGTPVPGARVTLRNRDERGPRGYVATSGAGGRFEVAGVAAGRYGLSAEAEGYAPAVDAAALSVEADDVAGLEVELGPGAAIRGRLLGLDLDELAAVAVTAERPGRPTRTGHVDYTGRFRVAGLDPGDWQLRARLAGGRREADAWVPISPGDREVERDLDLGGGVTLDGLVLLEERPLAQARVGLRGLDVTAERSLVTDHRGAFRAEGLEPGRYRVEIAHAERMLNRSVPLDLVADRSEVFELATAAIAGVVVAADDGEPVHDVLIYLHRLVGGEPDSLTLLATDAEGSFAAASLAPGSYRLTARRRGYLAEERTVETAAGVPAEPQRIELRPTGSLMLIVRRAAGGPPPRMTTIVVLDDTGRAVHFEEPVLSPLGHGFLTQLAEGRWSLLVKAAGAAVAAVPATLPGPAVEVVLPPAAPLTVRVPELTDWRQPASLSILAADGSAWFDVAPGGSLQAAWPLAGGTVTVPDLPAGAWRLVVTAADGRAWSAVATTDGASPAEVRLDGTAG